LVPEAAEGLGLVYALLRHEDTIGMRSEEIESVIDIVRTTSEAEVAAVLKETAPGMWSVSLRSKAAVDVSVVAARLGGGGHRFASGYTAEGDSEYVVAALLGALS
jgi:phosphoesterase RecJ-like protein